MGGRGALGLALGVVALAVGLAGVAADAPALAAMAGVAGMAAGAIAAAEVAARNKVEDRVDLAERRVTELTEALTEASTGIEPTIVADDALDQHSDAMRDPETGLYGSSFFAETLTTRVSAARRHLRPVAVVLIEVAEGVRTGVALPANAAKVAEGIRSTLREADTACRLSPERYGLVLEDTPENGAVWTAERVRRTLAVTQEGLTLWAGVACYPAHAFEAEELSKRATTALEAAKEWRQDRIEVATTSEV